MAPPRCSACGTADGVASYNLCRPCLRARVVAERASQGLPTPSESPAGYARLGRVLDHARRLAS